MTEFPTLGQNWPSYCQLVQQLISGHVRRHTFTKWELELLLDSQMTRMRKASRPEIFRRYLRAVEQSQAAGAAAPPRFTAFFESEIQGKRPAAGFTIPLELPRAS